MSEPGKKLEDKQSAASNLPAFLKGIDAAEAFEIEITPEEIEGTKLSGGHVVVDGSFVPAETRDEEVGLPQTEPTMPGLALGMHSGEEVPKLDEDALEDTGQDFATSEVVEKDNDDAADDDFIKRTQAESRQKVKETKALHDKRKKLQEAITHMAQNPVTPEQSERLDAGELMPLAEVLAHYKPRSEAEVLENGDTKAIVQHILDLDDGLVHYRDRAIIPLRFGLVSKNAHRQPFFLRRGNETHKLEEVLANLPNVYGRGVDLGTASQLTGYSKQAVLKIEIAFLEATSKLSPNIARLARQMEDQLTTVRRASVAQNVTLTATEISEVEQ